MDSNPSSMWSNIEKKDPPPKPSPSDGAPEAIHGMVGNCKSTKGISTAVVDANAVIEGGQSLTNFADRLVTVPEVISEIRDHASRRLLAFIPFETREPLHLPELSALPSNFIVFINLGLSRDRELEQLGFCIARPSPLVTKTFL